MRTRTKAALAAVALVAGGAGITADGPAEVAPVAHTVTVEGDTGDGQATTTYDDAMVRRRAAIAIHPAPNAERDHIRTELQDAAKGSGGPLTEATFAVFSEEMLSYLVPEMTMVLPEGVPIIAAEAFMRDHQPADVAFYLVQPVLVHDLTFAVFPTTGVRPADVRDRLDREGILTDSLNHHVTTVQPTGVTVRYFGAVLSDATIDTVRDAMARAAEAPASRVVVAASEAGSGVDLSNGVPDLTDERTGHH